MWKIEFDNISPKFEKEIWLGIEGLTLLLKDDESLLFVIFDFQNLNKNPTVIQAKI